MSGLDGARIAGEGDDEGVGADEDIDDEGGVGGVSVGGQPEFGIKHEQT
jgi:hypothetical protein